MFKICGWRNALEIAQREIIGTRKYKQPLTLAGAITSEKFFYTPTIYMHTAPEYRTSPSPDRQSIDFSQILGMGDLSFITRNIGKLIKSDHPMLSTVSSYYFNLEGKKLRPLLVLLTSKMHGNSSEVLSSQKSLAFITEMIHTASLLHDDVIDDAPTRRGMPSANVAYGNKMSILAGDYLLSRASVALARLGSLPVVELLAEVIGELVEGEVMQLNGLSHAEKYDSELKDIVNVSGTPLEPWQRECFDSYLRKTYLKTASLMAKSCQASILLRNPKDERSSHAAYEYGRNAGIAFQLIDDYLDYASTSEHIGKPSGGADLRLGLSTAPILFASLQHPELRTIIQSPSSIKEDEKEDAIQNALNLVRSSDGLRCTKTLAQLYADKAIDALANFETSSSRDALESIAKTIVSRTK